MLHVYLLSSGSQVVNDFNRNTYLVCANTAGADHYIQQNVNKNKYKM